MSMAGHGRKPGCPVSRLRRMMPASLEDRLRDIGLGYLVVLPDGDLLGVVRYPVDAEDLARKASRNFKDPVTVVHGTDVTRFRHGREI